uniref:Chaperone of endosialidase n=1 Tax=Mimivirus LCMiAC01 TaxID=2506608 RepID=A0A481Z1A5_9VIRU|nr:MAG: chaperone of endosialidase [Mimivirus LCMiAC01]
MTSTSDSVHTNNNITYSEILILNTDKKPFTNGGIVLGRNIEDIISDDSAEKGIVRSNGTNNIIISYNAKDINNYYVGWYIKIIRGDAIGCTSKIISYDYDSKMIVLENNFKKPVKIYDPYVLFNGQYVGMIYSVPKKELGFCNVTNVKNLSLANYSDIHANRGIFDDIVTAKKVAILSDRQLKDNIVRLDEDNSVRMVTRLTPVKYNWKKDDPANKHIGLIAQDVEKIIPSAVNTNKDGLKLISYDEIIPVMIQCIKYLKKKVDKLEIELAKK